MPGPETNLGELLLSAAESRPEGPLEVLMLGLDTFRYI